MVGLPYPDKRDPELQQKLHFIDTIKAQAKPGAASHYGAHL
jgi:Rad3-related DNA helicase